MSQNSPVRFLGSKISLISKSDIRYEGTLYTIDTEQSSVALANVRSFGTENRRPDNPVPPANEVYDYIIFRGSDIEDLTVCEAPQPTMNPYMMYPGHNPYQNQYGHYQQYPNQYSYYGQNPYQNPQGFSPAQAAQLHAQQLGQMGQMGMQGQMQGQYDQSQGFHQQPQQPQQRPHQQTQKPQQQPQQNPQGPSVRASTQKTGPSKVAEPAPRASASDKNADESAKDVKSKEVKESTTAPASKTQPQAQKIQKRGSTQSGQGKAQPKQQGKPQEGKSQEKQQPQQATPQTKQAQQPKLTPKSAQQKPNKKSESQEKPATPQQATEEKPAASSVKNDEPAPNATDAAKKDTNEATGKAEEDKGKAAANATAATAANNQRSTQPHNRRGGKKPNYAQVVQDQTNRRNTAAADGGKGSDLHPFDFEKSNSRFEKDKARDEALETEQGKALNVVAYQKDSFFDQLSCETLDRQNEPQGKAAFFYDDQRKRDMETFGASSVIDQHRLRGARGRSRHHYHSYNNRSYNNRGAQTGGYHQNSRYQSQRKED